MKKYLKIFIGVFIFSIIMCCQFLKMHYASDTYNIIYYGYLEYPNLFFLVDARIFSAIALYIANFLNLSISTFVIGMDFIAITLQSISVVIMYSIIKKIINVEDKTVKDFFLIICSYLIIFNPVAIEYLLFAESAVMCLSVLLTVLAIKYFIINRSYIISMILLLIAIFCYQRFNRVIYIVLLFLSYF